MHTALLPEAATHGLAHHVRSRLRPLSNVITYASKQPEVIYVGGGPVTEANAVARTLMVEPAVQGTKAPNRLVLDHNDHPDARSAWSLETVPVGDADADASVIAAREGGGSRSKASCTAARKTRRGRVPCAVAKGAAANAPSSSEATLWQIEPCIPKLEPRLERSGIEAFVM